MYNTDQYSTVQHNHYSTAQCTVLRRRETHSCVPTCGGAAPCTCSPLTAAMEGGDQCAVSATHQYRKVMKPLLERKRRARINSCLEELKELMESTGGGGNGEAMQRLEKADVLEVTVRHLRDLKARGRLAAGTNITTTTTFKSGFSACAREVSSFLSAPDSGMQQQQALHIALGVAEGLRRLQDPGPGGRENLPPHHQQQQSLGAYSPPPALALHHAPLPVPHPAPLDQQVQPKSEISAPLDLSKK